MQASDEWSEKSRQVVMELDIKTTFIKYAEFTRPSCSLGGKDAPKPNSQASGLCRRRDFLIRQIPGTISVSSTRID